jgi:uncharacterized protein
MTSYVPTELPTAPVWDDVLPAKGHTAFELREGQTLRMEDIEGQQAIDVIFYNLHNLAEKFWAAHTAKLNGTIYITEGHALYSDLVSRMATIVRDTCGVNDVICGSCSASLDRVRYGEDKSVPGCMDNFEAAIKPYGLKRSDIPMCLNVFLDYPVREGGRVAMDRDAPSRSGDYMDIRADMDLLVAVSNCPQENNPCTGWNPSPLRLAVY